MSEVYLTLTNSGLGGFQKLVVVKLLRRELAEDPEFRQMFLEEARLAARLNHSNVVQTNDVGEEQGRYFIAMEYLEGQTFERVRRARRAANLMTLDMQVQMLVDVLSGLHYAHELTDYDNTPMQLVHRDVTPSNVFITYDGRVKLVDFGIAKVMDSLNQTRVGVTKGKARYMAPEQIMGGPMDRRVDIFSVGVMLWEILAGKQIWHGRTETEILRRVSSGDLPVLPETAPTELQQICATALAHQARDRYPTAEAMRVELEGYLSDFATPSRERGIGAVVSELFADERQQIRQLVETQMREAQPGSTSPSMIRNIMPGQLPGPTGGYDVSTGSHRSGGSGSHSGHSGNYSHSHGQSAPHSYGGQVNTPMPAAPNGGRKYVFIGVAGAVLAAAAAGVFFAMRTPAPPGAPGPEPSRAAASVASVTPITPEREATTSTVRGVTDDAITLGMSAAFSGASRELGNRMKLGLETAFAVVNESGGVNGRALKLLALDDGYDGKRALANVQELVNTRNVFAIIGNVGTPTAKEALPFALAKKVLFFGAFTGTNLLRRDPPDRYVFNYRASYEEETARMIGYLLDVKKISDRSIVVFAQNDSYGDAGFEGASKTLRKKGHSDELLRVGYERNTLEVDDAVNKVAEYHNASVRLGNTDIYRPKHPVKAIIMVGTYKASAKFIQKIRERKIDALFLNVSFVGSDALAEELKERGNSYAGNVIVTQVVPHFDSGATGIIRYREAMKKYHPDQQPDFVSLEGFVVGQLFAEGARRAGREIDTEKLIDTLEQIHDFDPGIGGNLTFGMSQHQASHKVWATVLDAQGTFKPLDMD